MTMLNPDVIDKSRLLHKIPYPFSQEKMSSIFIENMSKAQNNESGDLLIKAQFLKKWNFMNQIIIHFKAFNMRLFMNCVFPL